jgi:hypothetical protein
MNFRTHNDEFINVSGTSYKGEIKTTYKKLVNVFGEPGKNSGDGKTDVNWKIEFDNGDVANIYNYKNGLKYGNPNIESINGKLYAYKIVYFKNDLDYIDSVKNKNLINFIRK